ncbi:MAG TPA: hypothetical protein PLT09_00035 [Deltaproteobacteria bacterium]|nr:hypothetical protein [Deltaproteobacteria bacterium]HPR54292.1 hypothetical protein [Deltaproteobacteria bacterium]HXK45796.1 hypothetical protein [Deltaproteobacteria bacterium]
MIEEKADTMQDLKTRGTPLKKKRLYGPDVRLIHRDGCALVEKTYRDRPLPVRAGGRLLVAWETFIYSKLQGITGIPTLVPGNDPCTITTTFMGGHNLKTKVRVPDNAYFEDLEKLIGAVHERGVIHLDMRNRRNYGMDDGGSPYLVDFASSLYLPWRGPLWRLLRGIDRMGYLKVKAKLNPGLLSSQDRRGYSLGKSLSRLWLPPRVLRFFRDILARLSSRS